MCQTVVLSRDIDVREVLDDVVDTIIERVLKIGGECGFHERGFLEKAGENRYDSVQRRDNVIVLEHTEPVRAYLDDNL